MASFSITAAAAAVLADAPAHADTTMPTTASLAINHNTTVKAQYGTLIGLLEATISDSNGGGVFVGSAVLQRRLPGKTWTDVRTDSDGTDGISFGEYGSHARGNVKYRLHYLGGTDPGTATTFEPSFSNVVRVITLWSFKDTSSCPNGRCHISGRLIPRTRNHKIVVLVKHGTWQRYRVVRTTSRGTYRIGVTGSRRGTRYRLVITRTRSISATRKDYRVIRVSAKDSSRAGISQR